MPVCLQLLDGSNPAQVPAFQWLTGWLPENLLDPLSGVASRGPGVLYDRIEDACREAPRREDRHSLTAVSLLQRWGLRVQRCFMPDPPGCRGSHLQLGACWRSTLA